MTDSAHVTINGQECKITLIDFDKDEYEFEHPKEESRKVKCNIELDKEYYITFDTDDKGEKFFEKIAELISAEEKKDTEITASQEFNKPKENKNNRKTRINLSTIIRTIEKIESNPD